MTKDIVEALARADTIRELVGKAIRDSLTGYMSPATASHVAEAAITAHQTALSTAGYVIVKREEVEALWTQAKAEYPNDWDAIHEEFSIRVRAYFDASLKDTP